MSENPFQSPQTESRVIGVLSGTRDDLRRVAVYQKAILFCILFYIVAVIGQAVVPPDFQVLSALVILVLAVIATVYVFLLAMRLYGIASGVVLGILTLVPCVGLLVLLIVNQKATTVLRDNGHHVGLMGADLSKL